MSSVKYFSFSSLGEGRGSGVLCILRRDRLRVTVAVVAAAVYRPLEFFFWRVGCLRGRGWCVASRRVALCEEGEGAGIGGMPGGGKGVCDQDTRSH